MFRDTKEELERLEQALLQQEPEALPEADTEDATDFDSLLEEDTAPPAGTVVYRNFSNGYGKQLRNYNSGYTAYNTDTADTDLDEYCRQLEGQTKSRRLWPAVILGLLTAAAIGVIIWLMVRGGAI